MANRRRSGNPRIAGENIRKLRALHDLSQSGLGKVLGIDRSTVANWEMGRCLPSPDLIVQMQEIFKVSNMDMLTGNKPLRYDLANVNWIRALPHKSGTYLTFAMHPDGSREYMTLEYNQEAHQWLEKVSVHTDEKTAKRRVTYEEYKGDVLQWTSFPPCDVDIAGRTGWKKRRVN